METGIARPPAPRRRRPRFAPLVVLLLSLAAIFGVGTAEAAKNGKVLILASTVTGGAASDEANAATALGLGVDLVTDAQWAAMTTAQFAAYNALILGDPTCQVGTTGGVGTAAANGAVWGPAVDGNVIAIGTDEVYHSSQGGLQLTNNAVGFAANDPNKTGMMISLSCYYHGTAPGTPVPVLAPFGVFTVTGVGCYNDAHIVATHPALTALTDASLSNWFCSVHEAFDGFPSTFLPLVIAEDSAAAPLPGSRSFPDGTRGVPYILARGSGLRLVGQIDLTPDTATNPVGTPHTLTATVKENGVAQSGKTVTFLVISGPNAGKTGTGVTNASGQATFTYTGTGGAGTDQIKAEYTDSAGVKQTSNTATKIWVGGGSDTSAPTCILTATIDGPPKKIQVTVQDTGSGIASIAVTQSSNALTVVPAFAAGTTSAILVEATKLVQSAGSVVELTVTDVAGNKIVCDPVWAGTKAKAKAKKLTKKAVSKMRPARHIRTQW